MLTEKAKAQKRKKKHEDNSSEDSEVDELEVTNSKPKSMEVE